MTSEHHAMYMPVQHMLHIQAQSRTLLGRLAVKKKNTVKKASGKFWHEAEHQCSRTCTNIPECMSTYQIQDATNNEYL